MDDVPSYYLDVVRLCVHPNPGLAPDFKVKGKYQNYIASDICSSHLLGLQITVEFSSNDYFAQDDKFANLNTRLSADNPGRVHSWSCIVGSDTSL